MKHSMFTSGSVMLGICIILLLALPLRQAGAGEEIVPQTLFELAYGDAEWEIGISIAVPHERRPPYGPVGLSVGPSGDVYIADYVQSKIKRFDRAGRLLMATEGRIGNMGRPAIGPNGEMWAAGGTGADELTMFNPNGSRVVSVRDAEGRIVEARGGDYILGQIRAWRASHGLHTATVHPRFLYYDAAGRFYVGVSGSDFELGVVGARQRVVVFSPELVLSAVMLGELVTPQGEVYSAYGPWVSRISRTFEVRAHDGSVLREVDIPSLDTTAEVLPWMGGDVSGVWYKMADQTGHLHLVNVVSRESIGERPYLLTERLRVGCDLSVAKVDAQGNLDAALRIPFGPFSNSHSVYVDTLGDIYYFEFGPESLKVNLISAETLMAAAAKSPSKIVAVQPPLLPQKRVVALRRALDGKGWRFAWDATARRAIADNEGIRLEVPIGSNQVRLNGKLITVPKPAFVSSGRTYVSSSLVAEIVAARRVAGPATP